MNALNVAVNDGYTCLDSVKHHLNALKLSLNDVATKRNRATFSRLEHARVFHWVQPIVRHAASLCNMAKPLLNGTIPTLNDV